MTYFKLGNELLIDLMEELILKGSSPLLKNVPGHDSVLPIRVMRA